MTRLPTSLRAHYDAAFEALVPMYDPADDELAAEERAAEAAIERYLENAQGDRFERNPYEF